MKTAFAVISGRHQMAEKDIIEQVSGKPGLQARCL